MKSLRDINWNHLYFFYEVARANSLKEAADYLDMAVSTLSEHIKRFEKNFGRKLFSRTSNRLELTTDGVTLLEHAELIFFEGGRLLDRFSEGDLGGYPVTIGIEESISYQIASEFASQYWDFYAPYGIVNTVRQSDSDVLIENLVSKTVDWGISARKPKRRSLDFAEIGSFEVVFCCSQELKEMFKDPKDILMNIPIAESSYDSTINQAIYSHLRKFKIKPKERISSDHPNFTHNLCKRGRCIMFMPENPLDSYDGLYKFQLDIPLRISLYAIWRKEDSNLISIRQLLKLIGGKISHTPAMYNDVSYQVELSDVNTELLNKNKTKQP